MKYQHPETDAARFEIIKSIAAFSGALTCACEAEGCACSVALDDQSEIDAKLCQWCAKGEHEEAQVNYCDVGNCECRNPQSDPNQDPDNIGEDDLELCTCGHLYIDDHETHYHGEDCEYDEECELKAKRA